jgi:hypothetical protein
MAKTILCGPPHSGKSCLREGLKQAILALHRSNQAPYPYILTGCPDGEGAWYAEAARRDPVLARQLKQAYKSAFTWEFAHEKALQVKNLSLPLTIIDVGGKLDDKNRLIMTPATHAIILSGDSAAIPPWQAACKELGLAIVGVVHSDYHGTCDVIQSEQPMVTGSIHHLERGEDVSTRPMVQALARALVGLSERVF